MMIYYGNSWEPEGQLNRLARRASAHSNKNRYNLHSEFSCSDLPVIYSNSRTYRNPLIYARELSEGLVRDNLTKKQLAERHGIIIWQSNAVAVPVKTARGDSEENNRPRRQLEKQVITERELREFKRKQQSEGFETL